MRSEDVDSVAHVLTQAFAPPPGASPTGLRVLISNGMASRWQAQCAGAWVVDAPGFGPVGAVFAVVEPDVGWIGGLGVHPAYRGVGVGRALTTAALEFLEGVGCAMVGLEASPNDGVALGAYARRGLRPVDVTLRLRADAASLATLGRAAELEVRPLDPRIGSDEPMTDGSGGSETRPYTCRRAAAVPLSDAAFIALGPGAWLVCDPEAVPVGEVLEARVGYMGYDGHSVAAACRGLGRLAVARQLRYVELNLPVGSGEALPTMSRLGFQTVASTVRLARPAAAYRQASDDGVVLGRWSL
ncbi:MAG: GNAT family N-acetyltransferase [Chloroflexi bacterium]|nr:GNAT family N-acetyltransferase [Chloroflexota bacterium]